MSTTATRRRCTAGLALLVVAVGLTSLTTTQTRAASGASAATSPSTTSPAADDDLVVRRILGGPGQGPATDTAITPTDADAVGDVTFVAGRLSDTWPFSQVLRPKGICLPSHLQRADETGELRTLLVATCSGATDEVQQVRQVRAVSADEAVFTDGMSRAWRWTPDGVQAVAGSGEIGDAVDGVPALLSPLDLSGVEGFDVAPDGTLVLATSTGLQEIGPDGGLRTVWSGAGILDVLVTSDGERWIAVQSRNRVLSRTGTGPWRVRAGGGMSHPFHGTVATDASLTTVTPLLVRDGTLRAGTAGVDLTTGLVVATFAGEPVETGRTAWIAGYRPDFSSVVQDDVGGLVVAVDTRILREDVHAELALAVGIDAQRTSSGDGRLATDAVLRPQRSSGLASENGTVIVADRHGVRRVGGTGVVETVAPIDSGSLSYLTEGVHVSQAHLGDVTALEADAGGTIYLGLHGSSGTEVWRLTPAGDFHLLSRISDAGPADVVARIVSLELDAQGLLVQSVGAIDSSAVVLDPVTGQVLDRVGTGDPDDGPSALLPVPDGRWRLARDPSGPTWLVGPQSGQISRVDACGTTHVVTPAGSGLGLVAEVANAGRFVAATATPDALSTTVQELLPDGTWTPLFGGHDLTSLTANASDVAEGLTIDLTADGDDLVLLDHRYGVVRRLQGFYTTPGPWAGSGSGGCTSGELVPVRPQRLDDTRSSMVGGIAPGTSRRVVVAGRAGVPTAAAGAILNVTAAGVRAPGHLRVHPSGSALPFASNLNTSPGADRAVSVTSALGPDGAIEVYNGGTTPLDVVVDVSGWFTPEDDMVAAGSVLELDNPLRVLDTRAGVGRPGTARQQPGVTLALPLAGIHVPPDATAVVVNLTGTDATRSGYVTAWDDGPAPVASNLNLRAGESVPNLAVVPLGADGSIRLLTSMPAHLIADLVGWYVPATGGTGGRVVNLVPERLYDSRFDEFPIQAGEQVDLSVSGFAGIPETGVRGVLLSVTGVDPTSTTYLTVWPSDSPQPTASNLNLGPGVTAANAAFSAVSADGRISVDNDAGEVDVVVDVVGYVTEDGLWQP